MKICFLLLSFTLFACAAAPFADSGATRNPSSADLSDLKVLTKKYSKYCENADGSYKNPAAAEIGKKYSAKADRLDKDFEKVNFPAAYNSLREVLSASTFLVPPSKEDEEGKEDGVPWSANPITLAHLALEQKAINDASNCQQVTDVLTRIADRNYKILKLVVAYQASKLYIRNDDQEMKAVADKCEKGLITFKDFIGAENHSTRSKDWGKENLKEETMRAQALGLDLHYLTPGLATNLITMDFYRVKKSTDCPAFVEAEKQGTASVAALDASIGKVFLPEADVPSAVNPDTIQILPNGVSTEVAPGMLQTRIQLVKAHDVNVVTNGLFFANSSVKREGEEDACGTALAQAKAQAMSTCKAKFGGCKITRSSQEKGEWDCAATVYTQGTPKK